jgi:hypothetical protein
MSDNKGFDSMRDLVRALQQTEYGLRTGNLSADDLGKACDNARELYERLVVIRHKSREDRVHEEVRAAAPAKAEVMAKAPAPLIEPTASAPAIAERGSEPAKAEDAPKAQAPMKESTAPPPAVAKAVVAAKAPEPVEQPTLIAPVEVKPTSVPVVAKDEVISKAQEPLEEHAPPEPAPAASKPAGAPVVAKAQEAAKVPAASAPSVVEEASAPVVTQANAGATPKAAGPTTSVVATPSPTPNGEPVAAAMKETTPAPQQTRTIEATAEGEKVKDDAPKSASDYLKDANVTPAPAPEMAAIRAQQVVARSGPAPSPVLVTTVAEKMEKAHINDLAKAVTVSHKFWFTTELFGGDRGAYESGMARLNSAKDLAGAKTLLENEILPKLKKPAHEEALNAFSELLQRRFE